MNRASSLEEELVGEFAAEVEIKPSLGGAYEITVDGKLIFSKLGLKRFPRDGEIVRIIGESI
ncbi:Rdx family protein [Desulfotalea psychrophila]|uniref:Rdx family protein n=1 Tax=Desulfotalea psychrophila TaxID=84980 RepID=UPI000A01D218